MKLYHGTNESDKELRNDNVFFSTCEGFASDYGKVSLYEVELGAIFDSTSEEHILQLFRAVGRPLFDSYNNVEVETFEEYVEAANHFSDTWEVIERYLHVIYILGFDSVLITEGGITNYVICNYSRQNRRFQLAV